MRLHLPFNWRLFKRLTPKSLFGRTLVILVTPLLVVQVVLSYVFLDRHLESVLDLLANDIAGEMQFVALTHSPSSNTYTDFAQAHLNLEVQWQPGKVLEKKGRRKSGWLYDFMGDALDRHMSWPYYLKLDRYYIHVQIEKNGGILQISAPRKRLFNRTTPLVLIWTAISALLLFGLASLFMRNQIKPLWRLSEAAERFGKGQDLGHLRLEGATEIRKAAHAFNIMRDRLQRQMHERTELLAGVSHDLRTPLARMKLQMAMIPQSNEIKALQYDVSAMQEMIEGFLDFAHSTEDEAIQTTNVTRLLQEIQQGLKHHALQITLDCPENLYWQLKVTLIKRCLTNLLLNSSRYGIKAWITVHAKPHVLELWIDDNGPGIPEAERENVFRPFYRLDHARRQETGGTGLGMSVARDAVRRHGGQIWLGDSPQGGLRVVIRLPR